MTHELGIFFGGAVGGDRYGGAEALSKVDILWSEFDIKELCGCMSDSFSVLAEERVY